MKQYSPGVKGVVIGYDSTHKKSSGGDAVKTVVNQLRGEYRANLINR